MPKKQKSKKQMVLTFLGSFPKIVKYDISA